MGGNDRSRGELLLGAASKGIGEANEPRSGLGEGEDFVPDFLSGGVEFDGEDFFAADGVAGKSAIGEAGAFDGAVFFGLRIQNIDDAAEIQRPDAKMAGKQSDIGLRTNGRIIRENPERGRAGASFFRRWSKKFPSEQGINGAVVEFLAGAEKRAHVIDAIAGRR